MSRITNVPYFPIPPKGYEQQYFAELVRSFSVFLAQQQNPGEGRNTSLVLTNLPQDDFGLEIGTLFQHDGFVKITLTNSSYVRGSEAVGLIGTVTVTTT